MKTRRIAFIICLTCYNVVWSQTNSYIARVDMYVPAPGQFVNLLPEYEPGDNDFTMAAKCTEAIANNNGGLITLGAWGGYIVFHFDHPIVNVPGEYDLYIQGNAITGSSEAGIVMVSQDLNHNGLPDDVWYELSGSADTDSTNVRYDYELTYTLEAAFSDIPWYDNEGNNGEVKRNNFHQQEYFPCWITSPLTLSGTRLPDNAHDYSGKGTNWILEPYAYGYVDNKPNNDTIANSFDISWAVDTESRMPVWLNTIDFVKVYSALNQNAGWLGETSTEISGATDLHPNAVAGIKTINQDKTLRQYDLFGRKKVETLYITH